MPMPTSKKRKIEAKAYSVTLLLGGKEHRIEADTIFDAVSQFSPDLIKGRGIITVLHGALKSEVTLHPLQLRRLFVNKTARELFQKRMTLALK
jgi:hypothetical protein